MKVLKDSDSILVLFFHALFFLGGGGGRERRALEANDMATSEEFF